MASGAADVLLTGLREPSVGEATSSGMIEALATLGPGSRLLLISVASLAALPYIKHVVGRATPGLPRLLPSIPLLVAYCAAHLAFNCTSDVLEKTVAMFIFGWQASFKLLAFCMNRGPLVGPWSIAQMAAIMSLPLYAMPSGSHKKNDGEQKPSGRLQDHAGEAHSLLLRWCIKLVVFAFVVYLLVTVNLSPLARDCLQSIGLYCFVCLLMDGPASLVTYLLDMKLIPTFDAPWLSSSLADFWGRRWNVPTSHLLRVVVYDPIVQGRFVYDPAAKRKTQTAAIRALGMCATFLMSAVVHEVILYLVQPDGRVSGKWMIFFTLQGPLMVAENTLMQWCRRRGLVLNVWLARLITVPFLLMLGHLYFFSAANDDTDTAQRVVAACCARAQSLYVAVMGSADS